MHEGVGSMAKKISVWQTIFGSIVLAGGAILMVWGLVSIWRLFWDYISHSKPEIGAAIIAASGTIIVSVLSFVVGRFLERNKEIEQRKREIEQEIRKAYLPIYQELIDFLFKVIQAQKTSMPITLDEMNTFFTDFTPKILVWGSDRFIRDFSAFRESGIISVSDPTKFMLILEKLLYSIRYDCGHENKGLEGGDLLALFITDVRQYINK